MKNLFTLLIVLTSLVSFGQNTAIDDLQKLYNAQNFKSVLEKAKPLLENEPNNLDVNLMMGRSHADLGDFKSAIPFLDMVVKNGSDKSWQKAWALAYLGTCYFMLEDYDKSKQSAEGCINLNVTRNANQYANRGMLLFGFDSFYANWRIVESDNFRFHFQNMSDSDIERYVSTREEAYKNINKFFKSNLPKKIDFFVWESKEDAKKLMNANLGFADPQFCVVHSHYQQTRGHEMTHVISNYSTDMLNKTGLINEGTAVCFDLTKQDRTQLVKDWLKANDKKISIEEIWGNWKSFPDELSYPLAGLFVKALIDNFGREKFIEFFGNQTYENAKLVFGNTLGDVIKDFENKMNT